MTDRYAELVDQFMKNHEGETREQFTAALRQLLIQAAETGLDWGMRALSIEDGDVVIITIDNPSLLQEIGTVISQQRPRCRFLFVSPDMQVAKLQEWLKAHEDVPANP